ncbi:uncharacterized protein [Zea mays]|uniref:uncharacterized protein n=1 Tax=Zea mays TaxID=4577 RepID=UPI0009A9D37F|nr:uncharacterized protein LOC103653252 [Zea mays]|eukprot:XP_020407652.1 uncharacterized protein LOC103653252 [Zea mays]
MDVYFQPLVYDLLDMFINGVKTYDASKGEYFQLRAAIIWTITDFPGLGSVSGFVTSGQAACPDCHSLICSLRLGNGSKSCYMGHRRFLHPNHPFRSDVDSFGESELRPAPTPLSGEEILDCTKNLKTIYGKKPSGKPIRNQKRKDGKPLVFLKRRPIWFTLPYWKDLKIRYNFDVMHIEKNVCENIINTLLDIAGKSKDNLNARLDLQALGIRSDLHPIELEANQFYLPPAPYSMSSVEKKLFCQVLKGVKFPDGYAADIRHNVLVNEKKIVNLNTHGNHILLQDLLPLAVRRVLPQEVSAVLIRLSTFFRKLYSPVIRISDMQRLESEIAEILSLLEIIFPPSFFTINVHLMVHLPTQARVAGPIHFRSMWPVERFLKKCKGYVRTKSHPEGSIMEGSLFDEALTLCSRYLQDETHFNHRVRNRLPTQICVTTPFFHKIGRALAGKCVVNLDHKTWLQAHRYVLFNYSNIEPYLNKHAQYLSSIGVRNQRETNHMQHKTFHEWFRLHVEETCEEASEEIKILAKGPMMIAHQYNSYSINGFNFRTQSYDENRSGKTSFIGKSARQLSSAIGCQVRKKLSIATTDWRLVDINKKYELWEDIKTYYDVDAAALNWVMRTAGKKWKQFKASIKQRYFNPELSIKEIPECPDKRVNDDDWHSMYNYWMSSEFQDRSEKAKINRQKLKMHHTAGSVSYACSEYDLAVKLGRPPRRDENFIQTHTRKNGVPTEQAKPIIVRLCC